MSGKPWHVGLGNIFFGRKKEAEPEAPSIKFHGRKADMVIIDEIAPIPVSYGTQISKIMGDRINADLLKAANANLFNASSGSFNQLSSTSVETALSMDKLSEALKQISASGLFDTYDPLSEVTRHALPDAKYRMDQAAAKEYFANMRQTTLELERHEKLKQEAALVEQEETNAALAELPNFGMF